MKKKKKMLTLVIAVCALAALIAVFVAVRAWSARVKEEDSTSRPALTEVTADEITQIALTDADGKTETYTRSGTEWTCDESPDTKLDDNAVDAVASGLTGVSVYQEMDDVTDLSQYGLDEDGIQGKAEIMVNDGSMVTITMGAQNTATGNVYVYLNDDTSKVYAVTSTIQTSMQKTLADLTAASSDSVSAASSSEGGGADAALPESGSDSTEAGSAAADAS